jgi:hypothetical protein
MLKCGEHTIRPVDAKRSAPRPVFYPRSSQLLSHR